MKTVKIPEDSKMVFMNHPIAIFDFFVDARMVASVPRAPGCLGEWS